MKRHHRPPLLVSTLPDVYLIDTSAWLNIESRRDAKEVWQLIEWLLQQERVAICAMVLAELKENPIYLTRLKQHEDALQTGDHNSDDPEYLLRVGQITRDFPAMSKARGEKTPADPYVIALAQWEKYVVVADETCRKRPNRKIPGVCKQLQIRCLTLDEFVSEARAEQRANRKATQTETDNAEV
jgi:predicted nucleic acid-binding protein